MISSKNNKLDAKSNILQILKEAYTNAMSIDEELADILFNVRQLVEVVMNGNYYEGEKYAHIIHRYIEQKEKE